MTIGADQDVLRFEISVNHTSRVKTLNSFDNLGCIETCTIST